MTSSIQRGLDASIGDTDLARIAERRQRAKAAGLPLDASLKDIERAEENRAGAVTPRWGGVEQSPGHGPAPTGSCFRTSRLREKQEPQRPDRPLSIRFPWAVVVPDNRKNSVSDGRIFLSKRYRTAKEKAHEIALLACKGQQFRAERVKVSVYVCPPDDGRKRDIANVLKLLLDVLKNAAYADDEQVDEVHTYREVPTFDGFVSVTVEALP